MSEVLLKLLSALLFVAILFLCLVVTILPRADLLVLLLHFARQTLVFGLPEAQLSAHFVQARGEGSIELLEGVGGRGGAAGEEGEGGEGSGVLGVGEGEGEEGVHI